MAGKTMAVELKDYDAAIKALEDVQGQTKKAVSRTLSDIRTRAPAWIAAEVVKEYGIKKAEITPTKGGAGGKRAGSVSVKGESLGDATIVYRGRPLTPTHFSTTPKAPKATYTLKAGIHNGSKSTMGKVKKLTKKQRAALAKNFSGSGTQNSDHSPIMLMRTGNTKDGGTDYIPFQRKSAKRNDIHAIKTVSVPQTVSNDTVAENISKVLADNINKRLEHHMRQALK